MLIRRGTWLKALQYAVKLRAQTKTDNEVTKVDETKYIVVTLLSSSQDQCRSTRWYISSVCGEWWGYFHPLSSLRFICTFSRNHQLAVPLLIYRGSHTFSLPTSLTRKSDKTDLYSFHQRGQRSAYAATNLRFRKSTKSLIYVTGFPLIWQTYKVCGNIRDYIVTDEQKLRRYIERKSM